MDSGVFTFLNPESYLNYVMMPADTLFNQLLTELCVELSFRSFQKQMTINSVCPHCNQQCEMINGKGGLDIYGNRVDSNGGISQSLSSTAGTESSSTSMTTTATTPSMLTVECPCCKKVLAATRFAPHLEKCMGMGRQSARKRGNLVMKMAAGSENDSDDGGGSETALRTPSALQAAEDSFSQHSSGNAAAGSEQTKKVKVSPPKSKNTPNTTTPIAVAVTNSKQCSPSKAKRTTPLKGKGVMKK